MPFCALYRQAQLGAAVARSCRRRLAAAGPCATQLPSSSAGLTAPPHTLHHHHHHPPPLCAGPKALLQWLGVVTWFPGLAPPEDPKTAVAALYQQLAAKKLSRFREYAAIFPEACFLLIGDNGQVRVCVGRRAARDRARPCCPFCLFCGPALSGAAALLVPKRRSRSCR